MKSKFEDNFFLILILGLLVFSSCKEKSPDLTKIEIEKKFEDGTMIISYIDQEKKIFRILKQNEIREEDLKNGFFTARISTQPGSSYLLYNKKRGNSDKLLALQVQPQDTTPHEHKVSHVLKRIGPIQIEGTQFFMWQSNDISGNILCNTLWDDSIKAQTGWTQNDVDYNKTISFHFLDTLILSETPYYTVWFSSRGDNHSHPPRGEPQLGY